VPNFRILAILALVLGTGLIGASLAGYFISRASIREAITGTELPLTSDNVYSEIQKDLVRPTLMSSMMAHDAFLLHWVEQGENDVPLMSAYLDAMMKRNDVFTAFFVSERSHSYYHASGRLRTITGPDGRDAWYYHERDAGAPYKIDIDNDTANKGRLTIFINARVESSRGEFLGFTGLGLTVDSVAQLIAQYQQRYQRTIFFTDRQRTITLGSVPGAQAGAKVLDDFAEMKELSAQLPTLADGTYEYRGNGRHHYVNVRYIPELEWYLFVDKVEEASLGSIRSVLLLNLAVSLIVTFVVLGIVGWALRRFQRRVETLAQTDALTELPTRGRFAALAEAAIATAHAGNEPVAALMLDLDNFKQLNDSRGHAAGDAMLRAFAATLRAVLRPTDLVCRWGGDEFVTLLRNTSGAEAEALAGKIRDCVERDLASYPDGGATGVGVSQGLADLRAGDDLDALINRADRALYAAKRAGRNKVVSDLRA
jgi:diguanylate cyclase (GGDEF)-like protein